MPAKYLALGMIVAGLAMMLAGIRLQRVAPWLGGGAAIIAGALAIVVLVFLSI